LVLQITNKKKLSDVFVILIYSGTIPTKALTFTNENEFLVLEVAKVKLGTRVKLILFYFLVTVFLS
jgi:hypothetical protein